MAHAPDDELLSALLDGESAPGDVAHVSTCDVCQTRLASLRRAATAVAAPVVLPPGHVREAALTHAALEAASPPVGGRRVVALPRRRRGSHRPRRTSPVSAVAALVVALVAGGWALTTIGNDGDPADTLANRATASDSALEQNAVGTSVAAAPSGVEGGELGALGDIDAVERRYETARSKRNKAVVASSGSCAVPAEAEWLFRATLTYQGVPAEVQIVAGGETGWTTRILKAADCSLLASRDFVPTTQR